MLNCWGTDLANLAIRHIPRCKSYNLKSWNINIDEWVNEKLKQTIRFFGLDFHTILKNALRFLPGLARGAEMIIGIFGWQFSTRLWLFFWNEVSSGQNGHSFPFALLVIVVDQVAVSRIQGTRTIQGKLACSSQKNSPRGLIDLTALSGFWKYRYFKYIPI